MFGPDSHPPGGHTAHDLGDRSEAITPRPASVAWAAGITIVMSAISILANIGLIIAYFSNADEQPMFAKNFHYYFSAISVAVIVGACIAILAASWILKRHQQFRTGLTILAGLTIFFA